MIDTIYNFTLMRTLVRFGCTETWNLMQENNHFLSFYKQYEKITGGVSRRYEYELRSKQSYRGDIIKIGEKEFKVCASCCSGVKKCEYITDRYDPHPFRSDVMYLEDFWTS